MHTTTQTNTQQEIRTTVETYQGKKTGPKFRNINVWAATFGSHLHNLHHEVTTTNNNNAITSIVVELLSCTPPNSKVQESVDNTQH